jgi:hypothetical protein
MAAPKSRVVTREEAWQITCHEAGHAVVAVRHQIPFECVERGDGEHGEVQVDLCPLDDPSKNWTKDEIRNWLQFYVAGAAAELLLFGRYREYASSRDRILHDQIEKQWSSNRETGWEKDIQSAMEVLDRESVERVAKELDSQKKLTDEQVYKLLGSEPPWY